MQPICSAPRSLIASSRFAISMSSHSWSEAPSGRLFGSYFNRKRTAFQSRISFFLCKNKSLWKTTNRAENPNDKLSVLVHVFVGARDGVGQV